MRMRNRTIPLLCHMRETYRAYLYMTAQARSRCVVYIWYLYIFKNFFFSFCLFLSSLLRLLPSVGLFGKLICGKYFVIMLQITRL